MPYKVNKTKIVAETLAQLATSGAACIATVAAPQAAIFIPMAKEIVDSCFSILIENATNGPDAKEIVAQLQIKRTSNSMEIFRESIIEAMGLKPEFAEPIEALADAVEDNNPDRFKNALQLFYQSIAQISSNLKSIKSDTENIYKHTSSLCDSMDEIKATLKISKDKQPESIAQQCFMQTQIEMLSEKLRSILDTEGKKQWDNLNIALRELSWQKVYALSEEIAQWLNDNNEILSNEIKSQILLSLADVAIMREAGFPYESNHTTKEGWRLLEKAEAILGNNPNEENASRALRVRAKLLFIDGNHEKAYELLQQTSGASTVSLQIAFLGEENRWPEASELADSQDTPDKKWADTAIVAHIHADHPEKAEAILNWSESQDAQVNQSCVLAYIRRIYNQIIGTGNFASLALLTSEDLLKLNDLLEKVSLIFDQTLNSEPTNGLEAEALEMVILLGHVLRKKDICQKAGNQLLKWTPVMPELGRGVLRGDLAPIKGLADRFLSEHGEVFLTQMMAAMLLSEIEGDYERALQILLPLLHANDSKHTEEIATAILIAIQNCDETRVSDVIPLVENALGEYHRLMSMFRAILLFKQQRFLDADSELAKIADSKDYIWLQLSASFAAQQGKWDTAALLLRQFADFTKISDAYQKEAEAWLRIGEYANAISPLEKAYNLDNKNLTVLHNLALSYYHELQFDNAAKIYKILWETNTHSKYLAINYANCLANENLSDATNILTTYFQETGDNIEIEPLLLTAKLLHAQGNADEAIKVLLSQWERFSDNYQYLMFVVKMGYASGKEKEAHDAFKRLVQMLNEGVLPENILCSYSLDDMRKMAQETPEKRKFLADQYLSGKLPWLIASQWLQPNDHCYLSWLKRTQPLIPIEFPETIAENSLYSTNGFTVVEQNGMRLLEKIVTPPPESEIVADITALITLDRLGLLKNLGKYFKKIYLPLSYKQIWVEEQTRIPHHQPSQIEFQYAVLQAVKDEKIFIVDDESVENMATFDEYEGESLNNKNILRILQTAKWLAKKGKISNDILTRIESLHNRLPIITDEQAYLSLDTGEVVASIVTLNTIYTYGLLNNFCNAMRINISDSDYKQLEADLRTQEKINQTGQWYRDLIETIRNISNIEFKNIDYKEAQGESDRIEIHYAIDALILSEQLHCQLLVDDRSCQQGCFEKSKFDKSAAFGTDSFISCLAEKNIISLEQHADYLLQLMKWRYKFIIPSIDILLTIASRFKGGLPGTQLREIAVYLQDCMRDLGLYGGPEKTNPPTSMALQLFHSWLDLASDFLVNLWWDDRFNEEQTEKLSLWIINYFLPSWPNNGGNISWHQKASSRQHAMLVNILVELYQKGDIEKANRVFEFIRMHLKVNEDEISDVITVVSNIIKTATNDLNEAETIIELKKIFLIANAQRKKISWRLVPMAEKFGYIDFQQSEPSFPVSIIKNRGNKKRLEPKIGPFAYIQEGKQVIAFSLLEMLCAFQHSYRKAAFDNIVRQNYCPKTVFTQTTIKQKEKNIHSKSAGIWVPAVASIIPLLEEDFILNMAGFTQAQYRNHDDGCSSCWNHIIKPTTESLLAIDSDGWNFLPHGDTFQNTLSPLLEKAPTVQDMLLNYDRLVGHLTLSAPLDLGSQISNYTDVNGRDDEVWPSLISWLDDKKQPWKMYHACQALLDNPKFIPGDQLSFFWQRIQEIVELSLAQNNDADDAQIWKLESELAAHYLRTVDLGGYEVDINRQLTIAWWAAKSVTAMLTDSIKCEDLPSQIREWRINPILSTSSITHSTWAWLGSPKHSSCKYATLYGRLPRNQAILFALGNYLSHNTIDSIPDNICEQLCNCFCEALLTNNNTVLPNNSTIWTWDHSLIEIAQKFASMLSKQTCSDNLLQICQSLINLWDKNKYIKALEELPKTDNIKAILVCSHIQQYCEENADAANSIWPLVLDDKWCDSCLSNLSILSWSLLAQGLIFLQSRQGGYWSVQLPYRFQFFLENSIENSEKAKFFFTCLVMSSLVGNTTSAIKTLYKNRKFHLLQPIIKEIRDMIEQLRTISRPEIAIRLQDLLTIIEPI